MSFNERIKQIKRDNYNTAPVNIEPWVNPFLQLSDNEVYNKLLTSGSLNKSTDSTVEQEIINADNNNPLNIINARNQRIANDNNNNTSLIPTGIPQPSLIPTGITNNNNQTVSTPLSKPQMENLARHIMQEVYTDPQTRRDIKGFRLSKSLSTPEHAVYIGNKGKNILFGLRGTATLNDLVTDVQIFGKNYTPLPKAVTPNLVNRYNRDENIYNKIRAKYPNRKIIMAGHSLGNTLGMNILKNHKNDKNIIFYGYNGWIHPDHKKDKRSKLNRQTGDVVSLGNSSLSEQALHAVAGAGTTASFVNAYEKSQAEKPIKAIVDHLKAHHDFILKGNYYTYHKRNTFELNDELRQYHPEYKPLREVLDEIPQDYSDITRTDNVFVHKNNIDDFKLYLQNNHKTDVERINEQIDKFVDNEYDDKEEYADYDQQLEDYLEDNPLEDYDYEALVSDIRNYNQEINERLHPDYFDVTTQVEDMNGNLPDHFTDNIYITNSLQGSQPDLSNRKILDKVAGGMLNDDIRIQTSKSMADPGTIHLTSFDEIVEGAGTNVERLAAAETEAQRIVLKAAKSAKYLALGTAAFEGILEMMIYKYQHAAQSFHISNNLFLKSLKKQIPEKPIIRTGL